MPSPRPQLAMGTGPHVPRPRFADLVAALAILTPLARTRPDEHSPQLARATLFFPVIGAGIGALLVWFYRSLDGILPQPTIVLLLSALWTALSWPTLCLRQPQALLRILLIALKPVLLLQMPHGQQAALLFAPLLGRWAMVVLAIGARDADHPGRKLNSGIAFRDFGWTSAFAGSVLAWAGEAAGIIVFVVTAALVLVLRLLTHRTLGGVNWGTLCSAVHLVEVSTIALLAALL